jgi:hypothetical protein
VLYYTIAYTDAVHICADGQLTLFHLTPRDYGKFFTKLREGELTGFRASWTWLSREQLRLQVNADQAET